jgi:pleiotropic regulator 1
VLARSRAVVTRSDGTKEAYKPSVAVAKRLASRWPKPIWHPPWKMYRVISGHLGWVSSIAFDPGNAWFATGSGDRTIKIWDTASGQLNLTLTGHSEQVMGLAISKQSPYMFSCGLDKKVMCWDLEHNKVRTSFGTHT